MTKAFVKALNDKNLIHSTETLVKKERQIVECLIWHLEEIQARKLFISMGYVSLFECLIKHFKYSETTAYGRISILKIIKDVPSVSEALNTGELNITTVTLAQSFINRQEKEQGEKLTIPEKTELIACLKNKSTQEVKELFAKMDPVSALPLDQVKYLNDTHIQLQMTTEKALLDKFNYLKSLISHENINPSYHDLVSLALDAAIEKVEKKKGIYAKPHSESKKVDPPTQSFAVGKKSRYIPRDVKRFSLTRASHQCEHMHASGKRCTSKFQLEFDHFKAFSRGGRASYANSQVLCRVHNNYKSDS